MTATLTAIIFIDSIETALGRLTIVANEHALIGIGLPNCSPKSLLGRLKIDVSQSLKNTSNDVMVNARKELVDYTKGKLTEFTLPFSLDVCSSFEHDILTEVYRIPYGRVRSYGEIAKRAGYPKAFRAVGTANARNPLPLLIPCHRVVAAHGLGGYGGGLPLKRRLLALEQANTLMTDQ